MRKIKVLIVDDHEMIRKGLGYLLELRNDQYNFLVEEAKTGEEGIAKVKKRHYDIVLMDYQMPKMNGASNTGNIIVQAQY